jgi:hypothetical protein
LRLVVPRYPVDFMFQLTREEALRLRSQTVILDAENDEIAQENGGLSARELSIRRACRVSSSSRRSSKVWSNLSERSADWAAQEAGQRVKPWSGCW